jgi:iron(III) transport system ATP-binding protein
MLDVEFRAVSRRFADGSHAVRGVSFTAPGGKLTSLLGPSGCGKSTLLRIAAGLDAPTEGSVWIGGIDVTGQPPEARSVSLLFQDYALFPHLDVIGNVGYGLRMSGAAAAEAESRAQAMLDLVGLRGLERRIVSELSGGQQQRVALARALAVEPAVVLLDEPLSNLDDRLRRSMREEIRTLQQRLGLTVAYVTHDETEAMAVSDQVVVINEGRVQQVGSPHEVYEHPASEFVARFMGDAAIFELVPDAQGRLALGVLPLPLAVPPGTAQARVMVRPEAWRLHPVGGPGLPGRVLRRAYLGHGAEYTIDTDLGELLVTTTHAEVLHQPGAPVSLGLGPHGVSVLGRPPAPPATSHGSQPVAGRAASVA